MLQPSLRIPGLLRQLQSSCRCLGTASLDTAKPPATAEQVITFPPELPARAQLRPEEIPDVKVRGESRGSGQTSALWQGHRGYGGVGKSVCSPGLCSRGCLLGTVDTLQGRIHSTESFSAVDGPGEEESEHARVRYECSTCPLQLPCCLSPDACRHPLLGVPSGMCHEMPLLQQPRHLGLPKRQRGAIRADGLSYAGCRATRVSLRSRAVTAYHTQVSSKEIAAKVRKLLPYLQPNGGGITCSGGEAMLQPQFVRALFQEAHAMGLTTCIDTTGQGTKRHNWYAIENSHVPLSEHTNK